jgi:hypothetical protein
MALYKSIEIYTAKCKIDQTVLRVERLCPGFRTLHPDRDLDRLKAQTANLSAALRRHLAWLKRLQVDYGVYALALILATFALLGFGVMLVQNITEGWGTTIVIAGCTMLVSLFGALVNLEIEIVRLGLDRTT